MKKRIISLLLTVLMVMSLFSGLSVDAYAAQYNGANIIEYTMGQNDYVLRICQSLGLNYYTCKDAIMILNGIQDGQWNKLSVGTDLLLPASDYDAVLIANGARPTTGTTGAAATTATTNNVLGTATTGTAANTAASSADVLGYYIVPYTLSYGETVSGVCNSLGVNFSIFGGFIKQLNNVSSWNKVRAGDTIVIPTPYAPSVGTTCYGVMEHIVTNSDTAYGIVTSKGLNYNANERVLKVLNQTDNLAAVNAGQKFFYAVPLTVNVPGTANPGSTATTTTTTTVTDGNGTTTTQTTTTAKLYSITGGMSAADGTMLFYVGSKPVTAASAGTKVTVVTSTNSGKAIQTLTVKHSDGSADLRLSGDTFIMPGCDVRVDAVIKSGYDINISANYSGKASASVNGISVQSAVKGAAVVIKSTDPNYEVSAVYASYKKQLSASNKTVLAVSSANAFIMPAAAVDVEVVLKPVTTYAFYVNDPVRGSFYLEVNGSPVTRAAKGAKVTVVAKGNDGYEPTNLSVTKHMPDGSIGERVNVFSNTFTMPGYDVDVRVTFGAKGNNILVMPTQLGVVRAYTDIKDNDGNVTTAAADRDPADDVTDAGTGETVLLKSFVVDDNGVVGAEVDAARYNVTYDVERNSDGLKVNTTRVNDVRYSFVMPKGGVTVSATITTKRTAQVSGLIYLNEAENAETRYSDCNIYLTYKDGNNKDVRAEFSGKAAGPVAVPTLQYVDLRENSEDGISFVRYSIVVNNNATEDDKLLSEELTNAANSRGYFQIPDAAATEGNEATIVISAYFETGKVRINPAVITAGNGTVSFFTRPAFDMPMDFNDIPGAVLATLGTSVNSAEPGETVYVIAAPANGYKFDDDKYQTKLKVTRQDNGAALTLTPEGALYDSKTNAIWGYQYSFVMPAAGVDIECAFDAKPFRLYMKCVDETGKDISGLGLWQIAVNMEPGIVDNSMFAEAIGTVVNVEYGDYVTVAMTESGWSKYDMVSFRIDGKEYTADSLNHFYNFQMIDERAKDLEIVAVMRPRVPYTVGIHNLYATYVDTTKGAAQFVILDSPTGYSDEYRTNRFNVPNYVNKAVNGDKVGVIVSSINNNYRVEAKDITLYTLGTDADRIILKEEWVDVNGNIVGAGTAGAYRVFTFTMPDSDVYISVNFAGTQNALAITVRDEKTNVPVRNAVQVITNNANNPVTYDVGTDFTFDDVPYNTQVSVLRSTQALAESKVITRVDIANATGKSIPYTSLAAAGEGITFTMPNEPVWVIVYVSDRSFDLPLNIVNQVTNGTWVYRKTANANDPTYAIESFDAGDVVYVHTTPNSGYAQLQAGELAILHNGVTNIATYVKEGVWSFTMPDGGTLIFQGDFVTTEAKEVVVNFKIVGVANGEIKVNGGSATVKNDGSVTTLEGRTLNISSATAGYSVSKMESASGKGVNGASYTAPKDQGVDTLKVTLAASATNPISSSVSGSGTVDFQNAGGSSVVAAEQGATVTIKTSKAVSKDNIVIKQKSDGKVIDFSGDGDTWTFTMPAGGVDVSVTFPGNTTVNVTIKTNQKVNIASSAGSGPLEAGSSKTFTLPVGTKLTVTAADGKYSKITLKTNHSDKGVSGNTYTVPDLASDELTITLGFNSNPINLNVGPCGEVALFTDAAMTTPLNTTTVPTGTVIYVKTNPQSGYSEKTLEVKGVNSGASVLETDHFTMPEGGVNIKAEFMSNKNTIEVVFTKDGKAVTNASIKIKVDEVENEYNNTAKNLVAYTGQTISVLANTVKGGYELAGLKVYVTGETKPIEIKDSTQRLVHGNETKLEIVLKGSTDTTSTGSSTGNSTVVMNNTYGAAYDGGSEVANEGGEDLEQQNANQDAEGSGTTDGDEVNLEYPKIEDTQNAEGGENAEGSQNTEGGENVEGAQGAEGGENVEGAQGAEGGSADGE